ncbi:MAG TPA: hypothetical protein VGC42_27665, partial [Kofleriaceae bacterium]
MTSRLRARSRLLTMMVMGLAALATACKPRAAHTADRDEILIGATLPLTGAESRVGGFFKE